MTIPTITLKTGGEKWREVLGPSDGAIIFRELDGDNIQVATIVPAIGEMEMIPKHIQFLFAVAMLIRTGDEDFYKLVVDKWMRSQK